MRQNYLITNNGRPVHLVKGERELQDAMTLMYREEFGYTSSPVTRRKARKLRRTIDELFIAKQMKLAGYPVNLSQFTVPCA